MGYHPMTGPSGADKGFVLMVIVVAIIAFIAIGGSH